jgi:hypothetical protein
MTTSEILNKALSEALSFVEKTGQFMSDQLPDLVKQIIYWKMSVAIFWIVTAAVAIICSLKAYNTGKERKYTSDMFPTWYLVSGVLMIYGIVMTPIWMLELLEVWLAPKVYLIEFLSSLVATVKK